MAASNKSKKKDSRKEKQTRFSFLSDMDPDVKSLIYKVAGVLVGIFAVEGVYLLVAAVKHILIYLLNLPVILRFIGNVMVQGFFFSPLPIFIMLHRRLYPLWVRAAVPGECQSREPESLIFRLPLSLLLPLF